jgi:vancomycin resistance protein YoaR
MEPQVSLGDLEGVRKETEELLKNDIVLTDGESKHTLSKNNIATFLTFNRTGSGNIFHQSFLAYSFPLVKKDSVKIGYNLSEIKAWVKDFEAVINKIPQNAQLSFVNNALTVSKNSLSGRQLEVEELSSDILKALGEREDEVPVPVKVTKAEINEDNLSELGLTTLLSRGYSDFNGSPQNRIHNVRDGASKFNGVLIKPDEEFSFNAVLGPVEASTGYLPELVILENKTVPQYGGGLCQVSSTAFRVALNAGLPITYRKNHAYPVQYYKPYGADATIYLPYPDLRFINDTGHYILVQTRIEGYRLFFDFYGTKPNRTIKFAGNKEATFGVSDIVEKMSPSI